MFIDLSNKLRTQILLFIPTKCTQHVKYIYLSDITSYVSWCWLHHLQGDHCVIWSRTMCSLQPCISSKSAAYISNNSVRGWWKSSINTSTYMSQVSRYVLSCGNNLLRNPRTGLWKPWVTVIYKNLPPRSEVAGIKLVGMRELLQLGKKLQVTAFHLLALHGTKRM